MRLTGLQIQVLPGINPGFSVEPAGGGVTIVTGPNAAGKSSLLRALRLLLLEPSKTDSSAVALQASFDTEAGPLVVRRTGREVAWELEGREVDRPSLPDRDQMQCYLLSMEELLFAQGSDARLMEEIRRALGGGFDLEALRVEPPFSVGPRAGLSESRRVGEAERQRRGIERSYESLREEEVRAASLERQIERAEEASGAAGKLERALLFLEAREERLRIEAAMRELPPGMELFRGDEIERLERLERRREELSSRIEALRRSHLAAKRRLEETGLSEARPEVENLDSMAKVLEKGRRARDLLEREHRDREEAAAVRERALAALGGEREQPALDPASISKAQELAFQILDLEEKRRALSAEIDRAGEPAARSEIDRHYEAGRALRDWLSSERPLGRGFRLALVTAGVGALVAAVGALVASAYVALGGAAVAFVAILVAFVGSRSTLAAGAKRRFEGCGLSLPESWERDEVEARLREIETRLTELHELEFRAKRAEELSRSLTTLEERLASLEREKRELSVEVGFDPKLTATALDRFLGLVKEYERAERDLSASDESISRMESELRTSIETVESFLRRWREPRFSSVEVRSCCASEAGESDGASSSRREDSESAKWPKRPEPIWTGAADPDSIEPRLMALRGLLAQAESAEREMKDAALEQEVLREELRGLEEDSARSFEEAGLEPDDRAGLEHRARHYEGFARLRKRLEAARSAEAERRRDVPAESGLVKRVEVGDRDGLEKELVRAREDASCLTDLREELTAIRTRIHEAGRDRRLESALSAEEAAREALLERYEEARVAEVAGLLIDEVKAEYRAEHEPLVLRRARELLLRFTHGAFALEIRNDDGYGARDVALEQVRGLTELSSATRMQLLLATRLAWIEQIEKSSEALPLFLDEALTTSDEHRFEKVAATLEQLAREEGRQVIYLAARAHELALWERATGSEPHHVDLLEARFGAAAASRDELKLPKIEALPSPEGHDSSRYGELIGAPALDPRRPPGAIHLFHLLRDELPLLHGLMNEWRLENVGQLESLLESSAASSAVPDPEARSKLLQRCKAARAWVKAWRRGRGKPVARQALEASGAVSSSFMERVAELADFVGGDGPALIEALRDKKVARFRGSNIDDLESWLEAEGYIDDLEPLTPEEREREVLFEVAPSRDAGEIGLVARWLEAGVCEKAS